MNGKNLKPLSPEIDHAYRLLVAELDEKIAEISRTLLQNKQLQCGPGCDGCCMPFSVLPIEAAMIAEVVITRRVCVESCGEGCRLLNDGLCTIYEMRPVICRTQGLPLAYVDEEAGTIEVSACPLNFPDEYPLSHEELFYMDSFNGRLAQLNVQYCNENGLDLSTRIPLANCIVGKKRPSTRK